MDDNIDLSNVKTVTMNELLDVENLTILQGGQPIYLTSGMGPEWKSENLQYFLDLSDRTSYHTLFVAATDVFQSVLPRPSKLGSDEQVFKRIKYQAERKLQRAQIRRSLQLMTLDGRDYGDEIIVPARIDKPIRFVPFDLFRETVREKDIRFAKPFNSTMYEVFKDDPLVR